MRSMIFFGGKECALWGAVIWLHLLLSNVSPFVYQNFLMHLIRNIAQLETIIKIELGYLEVVGTEIKRLTERKFDLNVKLNYN